MRGTDIQKLLHEQNRQHIHKSCTSFLAAGIEIDGHLDTDSDTDGEYSKRNGLTVWDYNKGPTM